MSINIYPTRTRCRTCSTILPSTKSVADYQIRNRSSSSTRSSLIKEQQQPSSSSAAIIVVGGSIRRRRSSSTISLAGADHKANNDGQDKKTWEQQLRSTAAAPQPRQKKQVSNDSTQVKSSSACKSLEELMKSSSSFISTMKNRKSGIQKIKTTMKSRDSIEGDAFDEAIALSDKTVFIHLLQQLASKPISLKLAAKILPEIRVLLSHKNSNFVDTALDILDVIVTHLKESIIDGLESNAQSIGVDVAAEDRQLLCIKCKKALTEIYVNYHVLTAKLNDERCLYFNSIVEKFMDLVL